MTNLLPIVTIDSREKRYKMVEFTIGQLAKETGCKIPTIRYYEKIGLLPDPPRSDGNTRRYCASHKARLFFICHCRELGFSQSMIRDMLSLSDQPDRSCEGVAEIARTQLDHVTRRIKRLAQLKKELERMIADCHGGRVGECRIVEALTSGSAVT